MDMLETGKKKTMRKYIQFTKSYLGMSASVTLFDKVNIYFGRTDSISIGISFSPYERSLTFEIANLYAGVEVWRKNV